MTFVIILIQPVTGGNIPCASCKEGHNSGMLIRCVNCGRGMEAACVTRAAQAELARNLPRADG